MAYSSILEEIQSVQAKYAEVTPDQFIPALRQMVLELGELNSPFVDDPATTRRERVLNGVRCLEVSPLKHSADAILYLHGGGFVAGSPESHIHLIAALARRTGRRIIAPEYALAPEAKPSAMLGQILGVFDLISSEPERSGKTFVMGDSAGGSLALSLALELKQRSQPMPDAIVVLSPVTDLTLASQSITENQDIDPMLSGEMLGALYGIFLAGEHSADDNIYSPLHGELEGLPPVLMQVGSNEVLLDDTREFVKRARSVGVNVKQEVWPGMFHVWHNFPTRIPEAIQAIDRISDYLDGV